MSSAPLPQRLREQIQDEGPIPFPAFMKAALYDPEDGYYTQATFTTGHRGDFATAPDVGPLLGATLARPVRTFAEDGGRLVEIGPGSGRMIVDVVEALPDEALDALDLVLVEPFAPRREQLIDRLVDAPVQPRIVDDLRALDGDRTLLFANEVLDALPCEVARRTEDGIEQMLVELDDGRFETTWRPAPEALAETVKARAPKLPVGHRYEVSPALDPLLTDLAAVLDPGVGVFFDYGDRFEDVWPGKPDGTLRGFRDHQPVDPLTGPGRTDITYDVDFSRVMDVARDHELRVDAFGPQERLLVHLGLMEVARERSAFLSAKQLLVPGAFAGRFMALALGRGGVAEELRLRVDLDDPGLWDRGLAEPLGEIDEDLGERLAEEMDQAFGPYDPDRGT